MQSILLHGWGIRNFVWQGFSDELKGFDSVIAPCLYDAANKKKDASLNSIAEVLSETVVSDTIVIGWSLGGLVATHLAKKTSKIKAIVYIASAPYFVCDESWLNVIDKKNINNLQNKLSINTENTLNYFSGLIAHGDLKPKETNKIIRDNLALDEHKNILSNWLEQMLTADLRNELATLDCPIKFILGEKDSLINPNLELDIKALNAGIEVNIIKECGHAAFISHRQQTSQLINKFVDNISHARLN